MTLLVDVSPIIQLLTSVTPPNASFYEIVEAVNNYKTYTDLLPEDYKELRSFGINVRQNDIVVVYFSPKPSSLAADLVKYLGPADIIVVIMSEEEQLWSWFNDNSSLQVSCLIIESTFNILNMISRCHAYKTVRSILIRCRENELLNLQRYNRSYPKVDGTYADDTRTLIKLVIDLTLVSEEMGDEERENKNNELTAQRHYDRALKLCKIAKQL